MSLAVLLGSMGLYVTRSGGSWQVPKVICGEPTYTCRTYGMLCSRRPSAPRVRPQQVLEANAAQKLRAHPVSNAVDNLRAVLRGIDVDAERPPAERLVDHRYDRFGHGVCVSVGRLERGEAFQGLLGQADVGPAVR